jgi:hypothetical protein
VKVRLEQLNFGNKKAIAGSASSNVSFGAGLTPFLNSIISKECEQLFVEQMKTFPKDLQYRKTLANAIGLKPGEDVLLRPIIGIEEFSAVVKNFSAKNFMTGFSKSNLFVDETRDFSKIKNGDFQGNLHIHSRYSYDANMQVREVLNQAAGVAALNSAKWQKDTPFLVSITDHNNVDSSFEILRVISENTEKYKNLRVVLGAEFSTNFDTGAHVHVVYYGLNPFDEISIESLNFKDVVKGISGVQDGALAIVHPARSFNPKWDKNQINEYCNDLFSKFKEYGGDRAMFVENYYNSYLAGYYDMIEQIKNISDKFGFISTGGIDSHANNIFTSTMDLSNMQINSILGL